MHHLAIGCSLAVIVAVFSFSAQAGTAGGDWAQWGGSNDRNMVCQTHGLPDSFEPGRKQPAGGIDPATTRHVLWTARLGSGTYGNPTVACGRVFVGTDDLTASEDPRFKRTRGGMVKCFDEKTGELIWQLIVPQRTKLPRPMHFGHQHLGICSSPTVDGDRVYLISCAGPWPGPAPENRRIPPCHRLSRPCGPSVAEHRPAPGPRISPARVAVHNPAAAGTRRPPAAPRSGCAAAGRHRGGSG